jgi:serine/threonine protein kinase
MSPEQARGDSDVDAAADIYALGAMVFEILTGSPLYEHESGLGVLMAHLNEAIPSALERRPNLPPAVDEVLRKAVAKDRKQRYPTAEEFVNDLAKALKSKEANAPTQLQALTQTLSIEQLRAFEKGRQGAEKKKETPSPATPSEQQRQMTALFVDVTELAGAQYEQGKDTEWVRARMERLWARFDERVREDGGVIQSRTDDVGLALWGRTRINEDDPERAIRAALRMRD